jgi:hypothetical protein
MIINQKVEMEDERILEQVPKNPIMIEEDVNPSFFLDVDEPHSFVVALNGEDSQYWKKAMDFKF